MTSSGSSSWSTWPGWQIEQAVRRQAQPVPPESVERLRAFAASLLEEGTHGAGDPR